MATNEVTLAQLITRSRRRADQENSEFCTDAEVVDYINDAVAELHEMMVNEYELYYLSSYTYTLPADNPKALPDSFWKALGCDFASVNPRNAISHPRSSLCNHERLSLL